MYVRAIALALPLVLGIAACKTSSTQGSTGGQTASAEPPATSQDQATASSGSHTGQTGSSTGTEGSASATGTTGDSTASGTIGGTSDSTASGTMGGTSDSTSSGTMGGTSDSTSSGTMGGTSGSTDTGSTSGSYGTSGSAHGATAGSDVTAHSDDLTVSGKVTKISQGSIAIRSEQGEEKTLQLVPQTMVKIDGQDARHRDLKQGQEVRASYNEVEGRNVAVQIEAGMSGSTGSGAIEGGSTGTTDPMTAPGSSGSTGTTDPMTTPDSTGSTGTSEPTTPGTTTDSPSSGSTETTTPPADTK